MGLLDARPFGGMDAGCSVEITAQLAVDYLWDDVEGRISGIVNMKRLFVRRNSRLRLEILAARRGELFDEWESLWCFRRGHVHPDRMCDFMHDGILHDDEQDIRL